MDFIERQYLIDGVTYNVTDTPHTHERLRRGKLSTVVFH